MALRVACGLLIGLLLLAFPALPSSADPRTDVDPGTFDASAFDWVRPRFAATPAGQATWTRQVSTARARAAANRARIGRRLVARRLPPPRFGDLNCLGDEACDRILRTENAAAFFPSWEAFLVAWDRVRPLAVAAIHAARAVGGSVPETLEENLHRRFTIDQRLRQALAASDELTVDQARLYRLVVGFAVSQDDRANARLMARLIRRSGWPRPPLRTAQTDEAAWYLIIHARHDPLLRFAALEAMDDAVRQGRMSRATWAVRSDHIWQETFGLQRFGTKGECRDGSFVVAPVMDELNLAALRRSVGLPTMAEQRDIMADACLTD